MAETDSSATDRLRAFLGQATEAICGAIITEAPLARFSSVVDNLPDIIDRAFSEIAPVALQNRRALEQIVFYPFTQLFEYPRVRCYWINYDKQEYEGLTSLGMQNDEAFVGKTLPLKEPPYEPIPDTACLSLTRQAITTTYDNRSDISRWYTQYLFNGIDTTYSWHIGGKGVLEPGSPIKNGVWAISFDIGHRPPGIKKTATDTHVDLLTLKILDRLMIWAYADKLRTALYTAKTKGNIGTKEAIPAQPSTLPEVESALLPERNDDKHGAGLNSPPTSEQISIPEGYQTEHLLASHVDLQSSFIPAGRTDDPWIYHCNDPSGDQVKDTYKRALGLDRPSSVLVLGESGSGKSAIIASVLEFSHRESHSEDHKPAYGEINALPDRPEQFNQDLFGVDEGAFSNIDARPSVLRETGSGIVRFPEFLPVILGSGRGVQAQWRDGIAKALKRNEWHKSFKNGIAAPPFQNKALLTFEGQEWQWLQLLEDRELRHWERRCSSDGLIINIPPWNQFSPESHIIFLRWCLLHLVKKSAVSCGAFERQAFDMLLDIAKHSHDVGPDKIGALVRGGFRTMNNMGIVSAEGVKYNPAVRNFLSQARSIASQSDHPKEYVLRIGSESPYCEKLSVFDQLVVKLFRMATSSAGEADRDKIQQDELANALADISSSEEMLIRHYLLLAAVRSKEPKPDDRFRTQYDRISEHFAEGNKRTVYLEACEKHVQLTPGQLQIRGNEKHQGRAAFDPVVREKAGEIQSRVERISCAYPPFLHYVPFWLHPELGA